MSIFLFFIFFKSICLFMQNLVLRVHIRLFGPNAANRYYSTAYHYLKSNNNNQHHKGDQHRDSHHHHPPQYCNQPVGLQGYANGRSRRRHHQQQQQQQSEFDDQHYYNLKFNRSRNIIRLQQQQKRQREQEEQLGRGFSSQVSGGGITTTNTARNINIVLQDEERDGVEANNNNTRSTAFECVGAIKDNLDCCGEEAENNNEQDIATSSEKDGELKILIRKRITKKSELNTPVFE